jgi:S-adenosyl-L-methionine hydrolase (adenosine-forming)
VPRSTPRRRIPLVTLASDLGWAYSAQMRGILAQRLPPGHVVDLAHDLPPHAIREAAFVVRAMASTFPAGSVHVVVVDPGVGGRRRPVAINCADGSRLVGPDNGVLSLLAERLGRPRAYAIDPARLPPRARVGATFDGRDLFAPAAAALANGVRAQDLGPPIRFARLRETRARRGLRSAHGEVAYVDRFGNLITNIPTDWIPPSRDVIRVRLGTRRLRPIPWSTHYEALGAGRLGALGSSFGTVELAVAEGSAAERTNGSIGDTVRLEWLRRALPRRRRT